MSGHAIRWTSQGSGHSLADMSDTSSAAAVPQAPSARMTVRRGANRAEYDATAIREILDAGVIAHVGVMTDDGPLVLPMAYGVRGDTIYVHGAVANALLRAGREVDVCITVTIVDALVVARSPLHNSMNYRSVVVRGTATLVDDPDEQMATLKVINDHIAPIWDTARPPSATDFKRTMVLAVPLTEASAKVRAEDPIDDEEDLAGPHWSGLVPLTHTWGQPTNAADLKAGVEMPAAVVGLGGTDAHGG